MKVLVTGATGFIGRTLCSQLLQRGHEVRALVREPGASGRVLPRDVEAAKGDLTDEGSLRAAASGCEGVVHLAAWYSLGQHDDARMETLNDRALGSVLDAAALAGVRRVVHTSSFGVYGNTHGRTEHEGAYDAPSVEALSYTRSKRAGHLRALAAAQAGQDVVIAVPGSVFGPGDRSIIGRLLGLLRRGLLPIAFYPDSRMGFVHVEDVADGLVRALEQGQSGREYLLVDRTMSLRQVFTLAAKAAGRAPPYFYLPDWWIRLARPLSPLIGPLFGQGPRLLHDAVAMLEGCTLDFDASRARTELGWSPPPFEDRLRETLAADG